jgi:tetratricopeptide (TPR) repeat protein
MAALIGLGIILIGIFLVTVSVIWGSLLAFQEGASWGFAYLCIPILGAFAFILRKWSKQTVQTSFLFGILGLLLALGGSMVSVANEQSLVRQLKVNTGSPATSQLTPTTPSDAESSETVSPSNDQTVQPFRTYEQTMSIGYAAYNQGDYQTALINFRRALELQPGDRLATEAIQNTEAIIQDQP